MRTTYAKELLEGQLGWAGIDEKAGLPRWLKPGAAVRIMVLEPGTAMVEELATRRRGVVKRHQINIPPLYFLEDERRWVSEGHPKVLAYYRRELEREMSREKPGAWMVKYCNWVLSRWAELEPEPAVAA